MRSTVQKRQPPLVNIALPHRSSGLLADSTTLVALAALSYGLLIPWLGYYWDDWRILWCGSADSLSGILENYAYRPGSAWLFYALNRFVGTNYLLAHCMALAVRILSALVFWSIVRLVWPLCPTVAFSAAALFLLYPGFTQQSIPLTYQNYHLSILLCLLSIAVMIYAMRNESPNLRFAVLSGASLLLQVAYLLIFDGMIALEVLRLALVGVLLGSGAGSAGAALALFVKRAVPYAFVSIGFVYWRSVLVESTRSDAKVSVVLGAWRSMPWTKFAMTVPAHVLNTILDSCVFAWSVPAWKGINYREKVVLVGVGVASIGASLAYLRFRRWAVHERPRLWAREFALAGGVSMLAVSMFECILGTNVRLADQFDRFAYSASVPSVLLVMGVAGAFLSRRGIVALVTLLVWLSILANFGSAYTFKRLWDAQRSVNWQLAWRAPDIEPGTLVVIALPREGSWTEGFEYSRELNGSLNLHYTNAEPPLFAVPLNERSMDFMESVSAGHHETSLGYVRDYMEYTYDFVPQMPIHNPPAVLLAYIGYVGGTLRVVDIDHVEELSDQREKFPFLAPLVRAMPKSLHADCIRSSGPLGAPTDRLVGKEPPHDWQWYFQRAELARQLGRYDELGRLLKEIHARHFTAIDPSEWLIFLEAAIRSGDRDAASWIIGELRAGTVPFIPRVRIWLDKFLTRAGGDQTEFARSLRENLGHAPAQDGERALRPVRSPAAGP